MSERGGGFRRVLDRGRREVERGALAVALGEELLVAAEQVLARPGHARSLDALRRAVERYRGEVRPE